MHEHTLARWQHSHDFAFIHEKGELRTKQVLVITAITMVVEIVAGSVFGSKLAATQIEIRIDNPSL